MRKISLLFLLKYFLLFKLTNAQYNNQNYPVGSSPRPNTPALGPTPPAPTPTTTPMFGPITPKCYPETATAYFLPAPASSPKVTVLESNKKDISTKLVENVQEKHLNLIQEVPQSIFPPQHEMSSRVTCPPPPLCLTGLPDLIDEIPYKVQDRFSRLADSEDKGPVCESCAALLKMLPIFNFDQEVLDGFLAGLGIKF